MPPSQPVRTLERFDFRLFYVRRSRWLKRNAAATPATVRQNIRVLSQIPIWVLGTMWEAISVRLFCLEATSLPWMAW